MTDDRTTDGPSDAEPLSESDLPATRAGTGPPPALRSGVLAFLDPPDGPHQLGRLAHYDIIEQLGRGAFGTVLKAFDRQLHRTVAIKMLGPDATADPAARALFLREARAVAAVRDEHVIQIHAVSEDGPLPYLVMEFVAGESLQARLDRGRLTVPEVLRLGAQVARGLAAAHAKGLVHRDIKPANILIDAETGRAKVADFGLARAVDDATSRSGLAGTPTYMSPEQARSEKVDHRSDLFSLGSVLYAMCTGESPFSGPSTLAVLERIVGGAPRPIRDIAPDVPKSLCDLIGQLHAKDRADRIRTAAEVADRLAGLLMETTATSADFAPPRAPKPPRQPVRGWHLAAVAVGLVVVLACVVVVYITRPGPITTEPGATTELPGAPPEPKRPDPPPQSPPKSKPLRKPLGVAELLTSPEWEWGVPKPVPGGVNTSEREICATLTSDELVMVFARGRLGQMKLYQCRRSSRDDPFGPAESLPDEVISGVRETASLSGDGLLLATSASRFDPKAGNDWESIWVSERKSRDEPFAAPRRLPPPVNGPNARATAPVLSADGLTLLCTPLQRPAGGGSNDVAVYTRASLGDPFGGEVVLPAPVNSPAHEVGCWVSDDRRVLIRTRMDKPPFESHLFVRATPDGEFGEGLKFVIPGVPDGVEVGRPWLSPDGMRLYFHARGLPGGPGEVDIWVSERKPKAK